MAETTEDRDARIAREKAATKAEADRVAGRLGPFPNPSAAQAEADRLAGRSPGPRFADPALNRPADVADGFTANEVVNRIVKMLNGGEAKRAVALGHAWPLSDDELDFVVSKRPEYRALYNDFNPTAAF